MDVKLNRSLQKIYKLGVTNSSILFSNELVSLIIFIFFMFIILGISLFTYVKTNSITDVLFNGLLILAVSILLGVFGNIDFFMETNTNPLLQKDLVILHKKLVNPHKYINPNSGQFDWEPSKPDYLKYKKE